MNDGGEEETLPTHFQQLEGYRSKLTSSFSETAAMVECSEIRSDSKNQTGRNFRGKNLMKILLSGNFEKYSKMLIKKLI